MEYYSSALSGVTLYTFGSRLDEESQAKALFRLLRDADKGGHSELFAPLPATEGIGLALYNRMIRAAAHNIKKL